MDQEIKIKDFYGRIKGTIIVKPNGDKLVKNFYGRILGDYKAGMNVTRDFYGRIIAQGDAAASLIDLDSNN